MVEKLLTKFVGKFRVHVTNNNVGKPMELKYILYITICDLACFYFGLNTNEMSIFFEYTNNYKYTILSLCCRKNDDKIHGCTSDHFWVWIWRGCRRLRGDIVSNFCAWHISYSTIYFSISEFIPFKRNDWMIFWFVLKKPTCPAVSKSWFSLKTWILNFDEISKYILCLYHSMYFSCDYLDFVSLLF